jgi:alpha-D-xyloside xylohydrolase
MSLPIESAEHSGTAVVFTSGTHRMRIAFPTPAVARVTLTAGKPFLTTPSRVVTAVREGAACTLDESSDEYTVMTDGMRLEVNRATGALRYFRADGTLLFSEPARGGKWLIAKPLYRNVFERGAGTEGAQSIDGARAAALPHTTVFDRDAFEAKLEFCFSEDDALFGLGSYEEGYGNLRGRSREMYQQNMKAVVPHLVSSRGYGVLLDCGSLMTFHDDALGSYWWADAVDELDFYVIAGHTHDDVLRGYRHLTGRAPMPPRWAFGFIQSKERYVNAAELLDVAREYRCRNVPLDCIVLDWKSWPDGGGWGQKSFDAVRFPEPRMLTDELHALGIRLMVSVWPIMTGGCENQRELLDAGLMLGNASTYDAFKPKARALYWKQAERGLFAHGVDAWWCDCTEPFEADWTGAVKPEPHTRLLLNTEESKRYLAADEINLYSLLHSQGMYEGQRSATVDKRVLNLTRSSYAGQSRYGTVTWNGDICATWETLRRCIAEGLNFCATGEAWWTVDAGGFFLRNDPTLWFWRGDYDAGTRGLTPPDAIVPDAGDRGCTDLGFHELYTRWMQYAAWLPMMRSHGTDAAREIWRFGEPGGIFYDALASTIRERMRMLPYLYSVAAGVVFGGGDMMRALALEFPLDRVTHEVDDQFLCGPSLMICPVWRAMLHGSRSSSLDDTEQSRRVYLPQSNGWYDVSDGRCFQGGQWIDAPAPLARIPVFARAGSIVVRGPVRQHAGEMPDAAWEIAVYTGADALFTVYEDEGGSYAYEQGACARVTLQWNESANELIVRPRDGDYAGLLKERAIEVRVISPQGTWFARALYSGSVLHVGCTDRG